MTPARSVAYPASAGAYRERPLRRRRPLELQDVRPQLLDGLVPAAHLRLEPLEPLLELLLDLLEVGAHHLLDGYQDVGEVLLLVLEGGCDGTGPG